MNSEVEKRARLVIEHLLRSVANPPSAGDLASVAGFSRFHFHRVFQRLMGETLGDMSRRLRLEAGAHMLRTGGERSVGEIAFDCGFDSHEGFTRAFKSQFNCSPTEFRDKGELRYEIPSPNQVHFGWPVRPILAPSGDIDMETTITTFGPARFAGIRHVGPYPQIGSVFGRLGGWVGQNQIKAGNFVMFCYDDPGSTPEAELRSDAACEVPADFTTDDPNIRVFDMPEIKVITATHMGSYAGLGEAWGKFCAFGVPAAGVKPDGQWSFEVYRNDCSKVPENEVRTDIYLSIE